MTTMTAPPAQGGASTSSLRAAPGRGMRKFKDNLATTLVAAAFGLALIPLVWLMWTVVSRGWRALVDTGWWTSDQRNITPRVEGGGVLHAILGTFLQVALCSLIAVPLAILVAIYLVEYGTGRLARATSFMVDILSGVPSIVAALFIYAVFITTFGGQRSGYLISLALVMLMVPVIVRTSEEMLKLVPNELREASYALGVPKWRTILRVVLPTAASGIVTGVVLGVARVAGETAPLLILIGYNPNTNLRLFGSDPQAALPTMIYDQFKNVGNTTILQDGHRVTVHYAADRMWGAALTLIVLVMALNLIARLIARRNPVSN